MWVLVTRAVGLVFGEDIVKLVVGVMVGLFCLAFVESAGVTAAIMGQPWGQWWLAGASGGLGGQPAPPVVTVPLQASPAAPQVADLPLKVPVSAPVPLAALDRTTAIIAQAMTWLKVRYEWGGCSRAGVDCSCFLQNVLRAVGINAPRNTLTQIAWTKPVPLSAVQPTDFLYWNNTCTGCGGNPTHVGMYIGDGMMIHAGDPVHIESINTAYWSVHFNSAGRIP